MFNVKIGEVPNGDIGYAVGRDGVYLKRNTKYITSLTKIDKIPHLPKINLDIKMHIPKIPYKLCMEALSFFRRVLLSISSESIVIILLHEETNKYKLFYPDQQCSSMFLKYDADKIENEVGWIKLGTIHSHPMFSAFHSSMDHTDADDWDGIHITFGKINYKEFECSIMLNAVGQSILVKNEDILTYVETADINSSNVCFIPENERLIQYYANKAQNMFHIHVTNSTPRDLFSTVFGANKNNRVVHNGESLKKTPISFCDRCVHNLRAISHDTDEDCFQENDFNIFDDI